MAKSKRSPDAPFWFDGRNINEALFCDDFQTSCPCVAKSLRNCVAVP